MTDRPAVSTARRLLMLVRDGWLILGIALALFVALELSWRGVTSVRARLAPPRNDQRLDPRHPYAAAPWWPAWLRQDILRAHYRFDPYRTWWKKPVSGSLAHVDSAGRRVTIQPAPTAAAPRARVFLFGGSVMWGTTARDSFTIPALLAARLAARGIHHAELHNYASIGYNATQEVITLLLLLRDGERPDLAVFLDGHNDVAGAWRDGRAGGVLNQQMYARNVERGTASTWRLAGELGLRSTLVQSLVRLPAPAPRRLRDADPVHLCDDVSARYHALVSAAEGLGREFGFTPLFLGQPSLDLSAKRLTPWEASLGPSPYREMMRRCWAALRGRLAGRPSYVPIEDVFDTVTTSVFIDNASHVTEYGNALIADRIVDLIAPRLRARP